MNCSRFGHSRQRLANQRWPRRRNWRPNIYRATRRKSVRCAMRWRKGLWRKAEDYTVFRRTRLIENVAEHAIVQAIRLVGSAAAHFGKDRDRSPLPLPLVLNSRHESAKQALGLHRRVRRTWPVF